LDGSVTPATYVSFLNMINVTDLARFGLHNGDPADQTLIDAKWESLAVAPIMDDDFPHDFFVFTAVSSTSSSVLSVLFLSTVPTAHASLARTPSSL
jgi:hypothetical protein